MILSKIYNIYKTQGSKHLALSIWTHSWMRLAGPTFLGRFATWVATWPVPPYGHRRFLANIYPKGYTAPDAQIHCPSLKKGKNVFIGEKVLIYQGHDGGTIEFQDNVYIVRDSIMITGQGGSIIIGKDTHILPRCHFSAFLSSIYIGSGAQIAPNCSFFPYNHGIKAGEIIAQQPFSTKGDIIVGDDAWIGAGSIILDGVRIGKGAVIGAGSIVTSDIPDGGVAFGAPAKLIKFRD